MFIEGRNTRRGPPRAPLPGAAYFITYRLAGSLDPTTVARLRAGRLRWLHRFAVRGTDPVERLPRASRLLFDRLDDHLDRVSRGTLIRPEIAALVRDNLRRHDGRGHRLLAYCVMPNHVHALIRRPTTARPAEPGMLGEQPDATGALARLMRSWKDASADWHPESYVHLVTDAEELSRLVEYIAYNPVKAGLVRQAHEWPWCSAHDRFHADGRETAWLPTDYELP